MTYSERELEFTFAKNRKLRCWRLKKNKNKAKEVRHNEYAEEQKKQKLESDTTTVDRP